MTPVFLHCAFLFLAAVAMASHPANSLKAEWIPLSSAKTISPRRSGHTAFTADAPSPSFVFGGYVEEDSSEEGPPFERSVQNDLWKWDDDKAWIQQQPKGEIPGPRLATASAVVDGKAYLFGGWDPQTAGTGGIILEEVHKLDLETMEWSLVANLPDGPASRHVALALPDNKILIHNHRCTNHVWIFDPKTNEFSKKDTTGESPGSVGLHTATLLDDNTVLVFGGATQDGTMSNQSHTLDLKTWTWKRIELESSSAKCPSARAGACMCAYNSGDMKCGILFGGAERSETGLNPKGDVWALHVPGSGTGQWELLLDDKTAGDASMPEPRNAATLTKTNLDSDGAPQFVLTGGWAPFRETWDDVFLLKISS